MNELLHDVRYGLRLLRRSPMFAAVALLTLAIGIGGVAAMFTVVNTVFLRPLPFADDERLVRLYQLPDDGGREVSLSAVSYLAVEDQATVFESMVGQRYRDFTVMADDGPERVAGMFVDRGWRETLGVPPVVGRTFTETETVQGDDASVVVISHEYWQRRFGGDVNAMGRALRIDGRDYSVIGVMPRGFNFPYRNHLWLPINLRTDQGGLWGLNVQAKLRPGVTVEEANAELKIITQRVREAHPQAMPEMTLTAIPTREVLLGDQSRLVLALFGAVGFVLLIVCANVGNLLLARSVGRRQEFAVRHALGASRWRQVRQVIAESVVLSILGGAIGLLIALWLGDFLSMLVPERLLRSIEGVSFDASVAGFTLLAALLAGVAFGLLPAARVFRADLRGVLQSGRSAGGTSSGQRTLGVLVVIELALAVVLLSGAGLMFRDLQALNRADLGYPPDGLTTMKVSLESERYDEPSSRIRFVDEAIRRLESQPGIERIGTVTNFPMDEGNVFSSIEIEGRTLEPGERLLVNYRLASPAFLPTLGVPLLRGRHFNEADNADGEPVGIITESMARRFWPGEDPIGKRIRNTRAESARWVRIVGVVADVREFYETPETWYVPFAQAADSSLARQLYLTVRSEAPPGDVIRGGRAAVAQIDPSLPIYEPSSVAELFRDSIAEQRFSSITLGLFAGVGLLLAALGVYGVVSYVVGQQSHEIGIRLAIGAQPSDILRLYLRRGLVMLAAGLAVGLAAAMALRRAIGSMLSEIAPGDPLSYGVALAVLAGAALLACYLPARRASRIDPMKSLRAE